MFDRMVRDEDGSWNRGGHESVGPAADRNTVRRPKNRKRKRTPSAVAKGQLWISIGEVFGDARCTRINQKLTTKRDSYGGQERAGQARTEQKSFNSHEKR